MSLHTNGQSDCPALACAGSEFTSQNPIETNLFTKERTRSTLLARSWHSFRTAGGSAAARERLISTTTDRSIHTRCHFMLL
jgi:hypothetical protein